MTGACTAVCSTAYWVDGGEKRVLLYASIYYDAAAEGIMLKTETAAETKRIT